MQPDERSLERASARAALAKIDPEWPREGDASAPGGAAGEPQEAPGEMANMLATIEALRGWQASLAELPPVAIQVPPPVRPLYGWRGWGMGLSAAAVLFLAVGVWFSNQVNEPLAHQQMPPPAGKAGPETTGPKSTDTKSTGPETGDPPKIGSVPPKAEVKLADSARWLAQAPPPVVIGKGGAPGGTEGGSEGGFGNPKEPPRGSIKPGKTDGGGGLDGGGGKQIGGKTGGSKIGAPPGDPARKFLGEVTFALRVPERLPDGWTFFGGKAVSAERVQLTYAKAGKSLSILAWQESGPDEGPLEHALEGGRKFTVIRRSKLCVALEGAGGNAEAIVRELEPRE